MREQNENIDAVISKIEDLIQALKHSEYLAPAKNALLTYLLKVQLDLGVSAYCRAIDHSILIVNGTKLYVQLQRDFRAFKKGEIFEIGNFGQKSGSQEIFIENLSIFDPSFGLTEEMLIIDDILVKEGEVFTYKSYEAVMTEAGQVYLKLVDDLPSRLIEGKNIFRASSKEYSLAKKSFKEYREGVIFEQSQILSGDDLIAFNHEINCKMYKMSTRKSNRTPITAGFFSFTTS